MGTDKFSISADLSEEYEVSLDGVINVSGFSGFGNGYFNRLDVFEFCDQAKVLSETMEGRAEIIGTLGNQDGSTFLETFSIRIYPLSTSKLNGVVGVHITLGDYPSTDCREEEKRKVSCEMKTRNQHLLKFSEDIRKLLSGEITIATLDKGLEFN
ncbi:MAG: hypothetical protein OQK04_12270 [Kangiellaceae bacterium]|nr:hypothetical protein [Kangiellaceae bacterium]MCW8999476.1 hypothetical protein [Kangiellaceae bacterium]